MSEMGSLEEDIRAVINQHSEENISNTPDYILATYLIRALDAYVNAVRDRDAWYGIHPSPGDPYAHVPNGRQGKK